MALSLRRQPTLHEFGRISKSKASVTKRKRDDEESECSSKRLRSSVEASDYGTQILRLKARAAAIKNEIVGTPQAQLQDLSLDDSQSKAIKARTLNLFDRVREKQIANSSFTKPSAEILLRRHAIGRLPEVVDILRMKQQQRMSATFNSSVHTSPSKARVKICLSLGQAVNEIKGSVANPISEEEARMCIEILSREISGTWLTKFTLGKVESVVLNGSGMSGVEVKKILETRT